MALSNPATTSGAPPLEPLEASSGMIFGPRLTPAPAEIDVLPEQAPGPTVERILLRALRRPPCVVAFSGGRDSSAILAEATHVARAHGLADPIPHTLVFPAAPRAAEGEWQEMVVRHLGLENWSKREVSDELDALGPVACDVIRRHGVHWPPNIHTLELLLEPAVGGTLVTGSGGDEIFGAWGGYRVALLRQGRTLPRRRDLGPALRFLLPKPLLFRWQLMRPWVRHPWMQPAASREVARGLARHSMPIAGNWQRAVDAYLRSRYYEIVVGLTRALAADAGVQLVDPFLEPEFVRAVAADAPPQGFPNRAVAMRRYFGERLPPEVLRRSSKAVFTEVFMGAGLRRFAAAWDGSGVDRSLVDAAALREEWLSPTPILRSLVPLQAAWLANA